MVSDAGTLDLRIVLLVVGRSLVGRIRVADKTVSDASLLSSSIASLNRLVNTTEILMHFLLVLSHVSSHFLNNLKVSADANLLLLLLSRFAGTLRLMLSHQGLVILSLRLRSSERSVIRSLRSLLGSGVYIARLRSSLLLDWRSCNTTVHSLVHGNEGVVVLITVDVVHALSHSVTHRNFICILILFIR